MSLHLSLSGEQSRSGNGGIPDAFIKSAAGDKIEDLHFMVHSYPVRPVLGLSQNLRVYPMPQVSGVLEQKEEQYNEGEGEGEGGKEE